MSSCKKRPFALAEVCVAVILVGVATAYIFSALQESIQRYAVLRDDICGNELADEHLARSVAVFLTDPTDFDTATSEHTGPNSTREGPYLVSLETNCTQSQNKKEGEENSTTIEKPPVALVELVMTVQLGERGRSIASRSALLCVGKEGT